MVALGRRVATKYTSSAVARAARLYLPGTHLPLDPGWLLLAVAFAGGLWLVLVAVREGVPRRLAERPAAGAVALATAALLAAPPPAWAGGNPGGSSVYRRWLFHDHLGTNVLVAGAAGQVIRRRLFEPFGKLLAEQSNPEPHDRLFTGQRYEPGTGLYDFQQRWYDAETGRFTGVDPVVQAPGDPQTVNAYGYVRNNPAVQTDSTGGFLDGLVIEANATGKLIGSAGPSPSARVIANIASQLGPRVASAFFNGALHLAAVGFVFWAEFASGTPISVGLGGNPAGAQVPNHAGGAVIELSPGVVDVEVGDTFVIQPGQVGRGSVSFAADLEVSIGAQAGTDARATVQGSSMDGTVKFSESFQVGAGYILRIPGALDPPVATLNLSIETSPVAGVPWGFVAVFIRHVGVPKLMASPAPGVAPVGRFAYAE